MTDNNVFYCDLFFFNAFDQTRIAFVLLLNALPFEFLRDTNVLHSFYYTGYCYDDLTRYNSGSLMFC